MVRVTNSRNDPLKLLAKLGSSICYVRPSTRRIKKFEESIAFGRYEAQWDADGVIAIVYELSDSSSRFNRGLFTLAGRIIPK